MCSGPRSRPRPARGPRGKKSARSGKRVTRGRRFWHSVGMRGDRVRSKFELGRARKQHGLAWRSAHLQLCQRCWSTWVLPGFLPANRSTPEGELLCSSPRPASHTEIFLALGKGRGPAAGNIFGVARSRECCGRNSLTTFAATLGLFFFFFFEPTAWFRGSSQNSTGLDPRGGVDWAYSSGNDSRARGPARMREDGFASSSKVVRTKTRGARRKGWGRRSAA